MQEETYTTKLNLLLILMQEETYTTKLDRSKFSAEQKVYSTPMQEVTNLSEHPRKRETPCPGPWHEWDEDGPDENEAPAASFLAPPDSICHVRKKTRASEEGTKDVHADGWRAAEVEPEHEATENQEFVTALDSTLLSNTTAACEEGAAGGMEGQGLGGGGQGEGGAAVWGRGASAVDSGGGEGLQMVAGEDLPPHPLQAPLPALPKRPTIHWVVDSGDGEGLQEVTGPSGGGLPQHPSQAPLLGPPKRSRWDQGPTIHWVVDSGDGEGLQEVTGPSGGGLPQHPSQAPLLGPPKRSRWDQGPQGQPLRQR
jgi:hypothetical protein